MGVKDLTSFNVAMLGKHGWKFQIDRTSLVSLYFILVLKTLISSLAEGNSIKSLTH